jgi:uncharacterized membrane protein YfhO
MSDFINGRKDGVKVTSQSLSEKLQELEKSLQNKRLDGKKDKDSQDLAAQIKMISEIKEKVEEREVLNQDKDRQKENIAKRLKQQKIELELEFSFEQYKEEQVKKLAESLKDMGAEVSVSKNGKIKIEYDDNSHARKALEHQSESKTPHQL